MLHWFISFTILKLSWIHFSVQKGCIVSSMASLRGQKGLVWGRAEAVRGEKHPMKTLCLTSLNTSNTTLSFQPSISRVPRTKHRFRTGRFIFRENPALCRQEALWKSNEEHSSHAELLASEQHWLTKLLFRVSVCVSDDCKTLDLPHFCVLVTATVAGPICAGRRPVKEPLCPALRPVPLVDLCAEERLFGGCDRQN